MPDVCRAKTAAAIGLHFGTMDAKIMDLEVSIAHQEKLIAELDEVVLAFTARVVGLERQLRELQGTVDRAMAPSHEPDDPAGHG